MLCIQWTPSETDGLIHRGGGEDIRDPDLSEAPESSQEGPPILLGEGGVREGFLEEGGPKLSASIFNFIGFLKHKSNTSVGGGGVKIIAAHLLRSKKSPPPSLKFDAETKQPKLHYQLF